jgi:hypothetical protein
VSCNPYTIPVPHGSFCVIYVNYPNIPKLSVANGIAFWGSSFGNHEVTLLPHHAQKPGLPTKRGEGVQQSNHTTSQYDVPRITYGRPTYPFILEKGFSPEVQ